MLTLLFSINSTTEKDTIGLEIEIKTCTSVAFSVEIILLQINSLKSITIRQMVAYWQLFDYLKGKFQLILI